MVRSSSPDAAVVVNTYVPGTEMPMINLIMQGRNLAMDVVENSVDWFEHRHRFLRSISAYLHDFRARERSPGESGEIDRSSEELEHLGRISPLGELAGSLAHEVKQPLTAILFNAQAAQRFLASETANLSELRDALEDIVADSCRANEVIQK